MDLNLQNLMQSGPDWSELIYVIIIVVASALGAFGKKLRGESDDAEAPSPKSAKPKYPAAKPRTPRPGEQRFDGAAPNQPAHTMSPPRPQRSQLPADRPATPRAESRPSRIDPPARKSPARSLRDQLVEALEKLDPNRQPPSPPVAAPVRPAPAPRPQAQAPQPRRPQPHAKPPGGLGKPISEQPPAQIQTTGPSKKAGQRLIKGMVMTNEQLKRAFVWSEILKPPVSLRDSESDVVY